MQKSKPEKFHLSLSRHSITCRMEGCGSGGTPANSRWNPTKEQIGMLESLYRQGVRTPNAEQIQQITSRLNEYGHIEGKNVFYWFQNHKARQRQKQKQETLAYFSSFLHRNPQPQPVFSPHFAPQTAAFNPYHLQQCDLGFHAQYDSKVLPGSGKRRSRTLNFEKRRNDGEMIAYEEPIHHGYAYRRYENGDSAISNDLFRERETLALFPLHPTDDLQSRNIADTSSTDDFSGPSSTTEFQQGYGGQPFIDFFGGKCS